ncbi:MAG: hypothetical protein QM767_26970 [Anaeromyxobacter sp.]
MPHALVALALLLSSPPAGPSADPARLELARLHVQTPAGPRLSPEVEALRGRRVRVAGYMARMEDPPRGALYLTLAPIEAEEGGAGTGDLPPGALRVELPALAGEEVPWVPDVIEAVGTLEVGRAEDPGGRVSFLRVVVDAAPSQPAASSEADHPSRPQKENNP